MRTAGRWAAKILGGAIVITALLIAVMGQKDGVHVAGVGVDYAGVSTGATLGYIPRFFDSVTEGRALTAKDGAAADKAASKR